MRLVLQLPYSPFAVDTERVIDTHQRWHQCWADLTSTAFDSPEDGPYTAPPVDFAWERLVIVTAGRWSTDRSSVHVARVTASPDGLTVWVARRASSGAVHCTPWRRRAGGALDTEVEVVAIPRLGGPVRFAPQLGKWPSFLTRGPRTGDTNRSWLGRWRQRGSQREPID
jgi:hypothetical protein